MLMVTHDFEAAIYLSDKIFVMSKRPDKIIKSLNVNFPKPRDRRSKDFLKIHSEIINYIESTF